MDLNVLLGSAVVAAVIGYISSQYGVYKQIVTAERTKWIGQVRDTACELVEDVYTLEALSHTNNEEIKKQELLIRKNRDTLILLTNPDDINTINAIKNFSKDAVKPQAPNEDEFIRVMQSFLKKEWEHVKQEASIWNVWIVVTIWLCLTELIIGMFLANFIVMEKLIIFTTWAVFTFWGIKGKTWEKVYRKVLQVHRRFEEPVEKTGEDHN